jgi:hypothetical protein
VFHKQYHKKKDIVIDNVQPQQNNNYFYNKLKRCKEKINKTMSNDNNNNTSNAYIIWTKNHDEMLQNIMQINQGAKF